MTNFSSIREQQLSTVLGLNTPPCPHPRASCARSLLSGLWVCSRQWSIVLWLLSRADRNPSREQHHIRLILQRAENFHYLSSANILQAKSLYVLNMGAAASSKQARLCSSLEFNAIFPLKKNIKFVFVPFGLTRQTKTQKILNHDVPMAGAHFLRLYTLWQNTLTIAHFAASTA